MIRYEVTEDISTHFEKLNTEFEKSIKYTLKELMLQATGTFGDETSPIANKIGRYNHWLYKSGQETERWTYEQDNQIHSVSANYSGLRGQAIDPDFAPWYEFSKEWKQYDRNQSIIHYYFPDKRDLTLDRDYAVFQETGADTEAESKYAKHQGAIREGLHQAGEKAIPYTLKSEVTRMLTRALK